MVGSASIQHFLFERCNVTIFQVNPKLESLGWVNFTIILENPWRWRRRNALKDLVILLARLEFYCQHRYISNHHLKNEQLGEEQEREGDITYHNCKDTTEERNQVELHRDSCIETTLVLLQESTKDYLLMTGGDEAQE